MVSKLLDWCIILTQYGVSQAAVGYRASMCSRYYSSSCTSCFAFKGFFWLLFVALSTLQCGRQDVKNILWKSTILSSTQEQKNTSSNLTAYCLNVFGVSRQPKSPLALKSFYWLRIKLIRLRSFQENKLPSAINRLAIMLMGDCSYGDHMRLKLSWSQAFVYGRFYPPEEAK